MPDRQGRELREARRESGLSFREFASRAGFSESHLRSVENGHRAVTQDVVTAYDRVLAAAAPLPWTQPGALAAIAGLASGGGVDRRKFVAASGTALTMLATNWRGALARQDSLLPRAARGRCSRNWSRTSGTASHTCGGLTTS